MRSPVHLFLIIASLLCKMLLRSPHLGFLAYRPLRYNRASIAAPSKRNFHASNPNRIIDTSVLVAHDVIQGFHSITGLPWVLSIPLTAITVRCCVALPLQVWSLLKARQLQKLNPLLITWSRVCQKKSYGQSSHGRATPFSKGNRDFLAAGFQVEEE